MKKLYALLIAVNDYPVAGHRLRGCLNDLEALHAYLEDHCRLQKIELRPLILVNGQAKRDRIIEAFQHFEGATDEDGCLFFFSGHGSRMNSPREFWHIDTDRKCESIVCYDSRLEGGRDLSDKELSYLIWKATRQEPAHFLALMDCCHAGGATRNTKVRPRMAAADDRPVQLEDLLGYEHHLVEGERRRPPVGAHVALAASAASELSVETQIDGAARGIFTTALLDALQQSNLRFLTYEELLARVQTRVYNHYNRQHPQLDYYGMAGRSLFLNGAVASGARQVIEYRQGAGWMFQLGAAHRMEAGAQVRIEENETTLRHAVIAQVYPGRSLLKDMDWAIPGKSYYLREAPMKRQRLPVFLEEDWPDTQKTLRNTIAEEIRRNPVLELVSDPACGHYHLRLDPRRGLIMIRPGEPRPVFKAIPATSPSAGRQFLQFAEKVAVWEDTGKLSNPLSRLDLSDELEIELFRVTGHRHYRELLKREALPLFSEPVFEYEYRDGKWQEPAFMLQVRKQKRGRASLWVGGLFFSEDYGITDQFLPIKEIKPDEAPYEFSFYDPNTRHYQSIIPLFIPQVILDWGEREIVNRIKIIASTQHLSLADFCQDPLELEPRATRGAGRKKPPSAEMSASNDWASTDINIRIRRPE